MWWLYILVALVPLILVALRFKQAFPGGLEKGDFLRVAVPRTDEDGPLAMGTRLDVAASLKKAGVPMDLALELKVWRKGRKDPLPEGLAQIDAYLTSLHLGRGTLVIFDARGRLARRAPRFDEVKTPRGRAITLLRL